VSDPGPAVQPVIMRPQDGRILLGVCAGLARWIETDAVLVRGLCAAPLGLGLLGAAWFHFHDVLCGSSPHWLLELSEWLSWLAAAVIVLYLLAAALIPNE